MKLRKEEKIAIVKAAQNSNKSDYTETKFVSVVRKDVK